ncbi:MULTISPECIES: helix-turn-helix domain-containing protein [Polaromonas]|uniref:Helix-turn-helix domain-containing protein n=1 Tax=Polaromonas aquatica TaxID=332657 RepID=A0ABW1U042_9BURK
MKKNIRQAFGERLRALRQEMGISQEAFANQTGIARSYMSKLEVGEANPSLDAIQQLADAFGVRVEELFRADKVSKVVKQTTLIPYAGDGTHFDAVSCRSPEGFYKVGDTDELESFSNYDEALDYLRRMGTARWMRPNARGNWAPVAATSWREKPKP